MTRRAAALIAAGAVTLALTACSSGPGWPAQKLEGWCGITIDPDAAVSEVHQSDPGFHGDNDLYLQSVPTIAVRVLGTAVTIPNDASTCEGIDQNLAALPTTTDRCATSFRPATIRQVADVGHRCFLVDRPDQGSAIVVSGANCFEDECSTQALRARTRAGR
ncbi:MULTISPECIES: hypothetical protein [unclassified Luteococcus]|uniref:hypothetical protein n=1 Tax=unclassified Luteococcus TaxID=2639923 RepID=UPI00313B040E